MDIIVQLNFTYLKPSSHNCDANSIVEVHQAGFSSPTNQHRQHFVKFWFDSNSEHYSLNIE